MDVLLFVFMVGKEDAEDNNCEKARPITQYGYLGATVTAHTLPSSTRRKPTLLMHPNTIEIQHNFDKDTSKNWQPHTHLDKCYDIFWP
jgi:hypothetical protein